MKGPTCNSPPATEASQDHRNYGVTGRSQPHFQPGNGRPKGHMG